MAEASPNPFEKNQRSNREKSLKWCAWEILKDGGSRTEQEIGDIILEKGLRTQVNYATIPKELGTARQCFVLGSEGWAAVVPQSADAWPQQRQTKKPAKVRKRKQEVTLDDVDLQFGKRRHKPAKEWWKATIDEGGDKSESSGAEEEEGEEEGEELQQGKKVDVVSGGDGDAAAVSDDSGSGKIGEGEDGDEDEGKLQAGADEAETSGPPAEETAGTASPSSEEDAEKKAKHEARLPKQHKRQEAAAEAQPAKATAPPKGGFLIPKRKAADPPPPSAAAAAPTAAATALPATIASAPTAAAAAAAALPPRPPLPVERERRRAEAAPAAEGRVDLREELRRGSQRSAEPAAPTAPAQAKIKSEAAASPAKERERERPEAKEGSRKAAGNGGGEREKGREATGRRSMQQRPEQPWEIMQRHSDSVFSRARSKLQWGKNLPPVPQPVDFATLSERQREEWDGIRSRFGRPPGSEALPALERLAADPYPPVPANLEVVRIMHVNNPMERQCLDSKIFVSNHHADTTALEPGRTMVILHNFDKQRVYGCYRAIEVGENLDTTFLTDFRYQVRVEPIQEFTPLPSSLLEPLVPRRINPKDGAPMKFFEKGTASVQRVWHLLQFFDKKLELV